MTAPDQPEGSRLGSFARTLAAARQGNEEALTTLFERFYASVERQVHGSLARDLRLNRPWLATRFSTGDVVQEVFRSVLDDLQGFKGDTEELFTHYLTTIVRNRLIDIVRFHEADRRDGRVTRAQPDDDTTPSLSDGPATDAEAAEQRQILHEILATFSERERELVQRRLESEEEFQVLADDLGYSSVYACRRAFYSLQATLAIRVRQRQLHDHE